MINSWKGKTVLITGGTGSFGQAFTKFLLSQRHPPIIRIFSRDEFKQYNMQQKFASDKLRFLLGDVRDKDRLKRAMEGVDIVVHTAALKQIPLGEYNPMEPIKTNILGSKNVVEACLDAGVSRAVLISSDKAAYPVNLYGATKMCAEKLFIHGNAYVGKSKLKLAVVRYGNVLGSRGSVVPVWQAQKNSGVIEVTNLEMTRFWITLEQACALVAKCIHKMKGGEIFIPRLPSIKIIDLARSIAPKAKIKITGIRPGEKLHEVLITKEESQRLLKFNNYYVIKPHLPFGNREMKPGRPKKSFIYRSDSNQLWLKPKTLQRWLEQL